MYVNALVTRFSGLIPLSTYIIIMILVTLRQLYALLFVPLVFPESGEGILWIRFEKDIGGNGGWIGGIEVEFGDTVPLSSFA